MSDVYHMVMFAPGFAPYAASENLVNSKLVLAMLGRGWKVDVISCRDEGFNYGTEWTAPWLELRDCTHEIVPQRGRAPWRVVSRLWHSLRMGHPLPGVRWAAKAVEQALVLHKKTPYDGVLSRAVSGLGHLPAMQFAHRSGLPWVANWNDPPGPLFPPPYQPQMNSTARWIWTRLIRKAISVADRNTFPCERLARFVHGRIGIPPQGKTAVIPHVMMPQVELPTYQRSDVFRVCHAGNLSAERNPQYFLDALARLRRECGDDFRLEFIGVENVDLAAMIIRYGLKDRVTFTGRLDYLSTLRRLAGSDVLLIVEAPCDEGIFLPSKLVDYIQAARPILSVSPAEGTVRDLLTTKGGGLCVDACSPEAIFQGVREMHQAWREDRLDRYRSDELGGQFRPEAVMDQYEEILRDLCRSPHRT